MSERQAEPGAEQVLGLFAKWPTPGEVKTRLAAETTAEWAAAVAAAFLGDIIDRLSALPVQRVLAFAPTEAREHFAGLIGNRFSLCPQDHGDLGQRMAGFVRRQLQAGAEAVVLLGTDSPTLPLAHIEQAFTELRRADVVVGPATDGGYYLLGCSRDVPPLFEDIAWGSSRVLRQTIDRLKDPRWRLGLLPPWYDVDTPQDWDMLCGHLMALRRSGIDPGLPLHGTTLFRQEFVERHGIV